VITHKTAEAREPSGQSRPLRILMVSTRAFPQSGGVETHIHEVAPRLTRMGASITLVTTDPKRRYPHEEWVDGVHVRRLAAWPAKADFSLAPGVYRSIVAGHWDLVHCQGYHTLVPPLAMLAAWRAEIPYVVTLHSGGHSSRLRGAVRRIQWQALRPLLGHAAKLIAVSRFEAAFFARRLGFDPERFAVIPNGSDLPRPGNDREPLHRDLLILSIGRLERYKGHHRVLEAMPEILRQVPAARLRIVGAGPYERVLRRGIQELGLTDFVEIGELPADDRQGMANLLSRAALLVLLSEYESQSIIVMEALSVGCPVVAAPTSALAELAGRGWIDVVPQPYTNAHVAAAIVSQLRHPRSLVGIDLPRWDHCARALMALYREVA
jgi:glycosyltransferase involved in cell wall biosynthesis